MTKKDIASSPNEPTILLREGSLNDTLCAFGYICRALLALLCTVSTVSFILGALTVKTQFENAVTLPLVLLTSLAAILCFSLMGHSRRKFIIFGLVGVGFLSISAITTENLSDLIYYSSLTLKNAFLMRLRVLGFNIGDSQIKSYDIAMTRLHLNSYSCMRFAFAVITVVLAALFCACILRKVHILPIIAVGSAISTIFLYYGMNSGTLSFAMMLSSLVGVAALAGYDRVFVNSRAISEASGITKQHPDRRAVIGSLKRKNSAVGGYMGLASSALAMLLMLIPISLNMRMPDIALISAPAAKLEKYFVALLRGENPDLSGLIFAGGSASDTRSTAYSDRSYTGDHVFTVGSDINIPIYLRNWVGTYYLNDKWYTPDPEAIEEYKELFGSGFAPELLTYELLNAKDKSLVTLGAKNYKSHSDIGYVTLRVDIRKFRPTSSLVFFPSFTDLRSGFLAYGTRTSSELGFSNHSDGIFSSIGYVVTDDYSTIANVPILRDPDFAQNLSELTEEIMAQLSLLNDIVETAGGINADDESLKTAYKFRVNKLGSIIQNTNEITNSIPYRYVFEMDDNERLRTYAIYANVQNYRAYVYDTYLTGCESFEAFRTLARSIIFSDMPTYKDMDPFRAVNLKVRKIIDYLSKNMVYTLTPSDPSPNREYVNAAETFLFDTHEGYCVQYATAAVMLLRSLGIPARYAEGYIADDFARDRSPDASSVYTSKVLDKNGHAWIEVYFDNYGWVLYEVTTPYTSHMYNGYVEAPSTEQTPDSINTEVPVTDETAAPIINDTDDTPLSPLPIIKTSEDSFELPRIIIIVIAAAALTVIAIIALKLRAANAEKHFEQLKISSETSLSDAKKLNEKLYRMLKLFELSPSLGEQSSDFAKRVDRIFSSVAPQDFYSVSAAMQRIEFASSYSVADAKLVAAYAAFLRRYSLSYNSLFTRLWRKYLLAL